LPDQKKKGRVFSDWKKNIPEKGEPYLYLSKGISNIDWANRPENAIRQFVKEKLELIIREEIKNFLEIEQEGSSPNYCVNSPLIDNMDLRLEVW